MLWNSRSWLFCLPKSALKIVHMNVPKDLCVRHSALSGETCHSWAVTSRRAVCVSRHWLSSRKKYSLGSLDTAPTSVPLLAGSSRPLELRRQQPHPPPEHNPGRLCLPDACVSEDPGSQGMCSVHMFILKGCHSAMMTTFLIMLLPTEVPYWKLNINPNRIAPSKV